MASPEQIRLSLERLPVETTRALYYAEQFAIQSNTNIGLKQLFRGVLQEMGIGKKGETLLVTSVLQRNGINIEGFNNDLALVIRDEDVKKLDANSEPRITPLVRTIINHAVDRARSRKRQELAPSDLLVAIAKEAKLKA